VPHKGGEDDMQDAERLAKLRTRRTGTNELDVFETYLCESADALERKESKAS